jgi:hypothetical protein
MIVIHRDALYSRSDLASLLEPLGIDPDTFISRLKPRKVFRSAWWGADLIKAIEQAPSLPQMPPAKNSGNRTRRKAAGRSGGELVAGIFTREEIGL